MEKKFEVGKEVFYVSISHNRGTDRSLKSTTVTKVGKKYIETESRIRFVADTMLEDNGKYVPTIQFFMSRQDYDDLLEFNQSQKMLRDYFSYTSAQNPTLEQLRKVKEILGL